MFVLLSQWCINICVLNIQQWCFVSLTNLVLMHLNCFSILKSKHYSCSWFPGYIYFLSLCTEDCALNNKVTASFEQQIWSLFFEFWVISYLIGNLKMDCHYWTKLYSPLTNCCIMRFLCQLLFKLSFHPCRHGNFTSEGNW